MGTSKNVPAFLLLAVFVITACTSYGDRQKERERRAKSATGDIRVALVWQEKLFKSFYFEGAELAADLINAEGGINGRKIRTVRHANEVGTIEKDLELAGKIAEDPDMTAVIGHYSEVGSIKASVTYEYSGIIYISPAATSVGFSAHGFRYVFRNVPSDALTGVNLADFVKKGGFSSVLVIDDRSVYGKGLADIFYERASKIGVNIVARRSYNTLGKDFKPLFAEVKRLDFDVIFIGGSLPPAAEVIRQARIMGVTAPFVGGNGLDALLLWDIAGTAADGTITSTVFHHSEKDDSARAFSSTFFTRYRAYPDTWAALGYDAVQVLAGAIRKSGTTVPIVVASHLRFLKDWRGVLGAYSFMRNGDVSGEINTFQVLRNGTFELVEGGRP